jgi:predicted XRE-type DNA-binding protein
MRVVKGSGNIYRDLGFADADSMLRKAGIVDRIEQIIRAKKIKPATAASIGEIDVSTLELWLRGRFGDVSEDELERCLETIEAQGDS